MGNNYDVINAWCNCTVLLLVRTHVLITKLYNFIAFQFIFCSDPCDKCVSNSGCEPQSDGSVKCVCPTGYNGTNCNISVGVCDPNRYMNNGSCQDILGNFTCSCPSPLSGILCVVDTVNDCYMILNPCANNGTCIDNISGYDCLCADGFTSTNCTVNIDDCDSNPCMNSGSCVDLINEVMPERTVLLKVRYVNS